MKRCISEYAISAYIKDLQYAISSSPVWSVQIDEQLITYNKLTHSVDASPPFSRRCTAVLWDFWTLIYRCRTIGRAQLINSSRKLINVIDVSLFRHFVQHSRHSLYALWTGAYITDGDVCHANDANDAPRRVTY